MTTDPTRRRSGSPRGEARYNAKLTDAKVVEARDAYRAGETGCAIARRLGITQAAASKCLRGHTWSHVPGAVPDRQGARFRDTDIPAIGAAYRAGESMNRLAARYGVGKTAIHNVLTGRTWSHVPGGVVADRTPRRRPRKARVKVGPLRGETNRLAKLTDAKVVEARAAYRAGETGSGIARRLGLAQSTVSAMLTGETWSHVPGAVPAGKPGQRWEGKLDPDRVREARRRLAADGESQEAIGRDLGVTGVAISMVATGKTWKDVV